MKLQEYIALHRPAIENKLNVYLHVKKIEFRDKPLYEQSINKLINTVTGGKLIRGILVLLAYESKQKKITPDSLTLAAAIELIHTGLLIHDDIMDNDYLRRGKPTVFAQSIEEGEKNNASNAKEYGSAIAICIGDLAFFMAYELLGTIEKSPENRKLLFTTASELQKVGFAQIKDVHFSSNHHEPTEEEIISIYTYKTARYSFSLPLKLGGILAGITDKNVQKLEQYGEALGIAFQIKDDELGIFGDTDKLGKPVGSDIRENKKTLYRRKLFEVVDVETKKRLEAIYGNQVISETDLTFVKESLRKYDILSVVKKIREAKSQQARQEITSIAMPIHYTLLFDELVDFTNNRNI